MTGTSSAVLRQLVEAVPGTERVGNMLVLRPTRHIVRGLKFEKTSRKSEFYLWSVVSPLFAPVGENLSLNYSDRISITTVRGDPVLISSDPEATTRSIAELLSQSELDRWKALESPAAFVQAFSPRANLDRPNVVLEFAVARLLAQDIKGGLRNLDDVLGWRVESPILPQVQDAAFQVKLAIAQGTDKFAALVSTFEARNVDRHFPGITRIWQVPETI